MKRALLVVVVLGALAVTAFAVSRTRWGRDALRGYATGEADRTLHPPPGSAGWSPAEWGAFWVLNADFGALTTENLRTTAIPWKLIAVLPELVPEPFFEGGRQGWKSDPSRPLQRFGLVYGARLAGPAVLARVAGTPLPSPLGYARGTVERRWPDLSLEIAAVNCSMCHGGRTWDAEGNPTDQVSWGVPNHSIQFDGLAAAVGQAVVDPRATKEAVLAALHRRFPDLSPEEERTYRRYLLPEYRHVVEDDLRRWGGLHAWSFGGPGFSHGAAIVRESLTEDPTRLRAEDFPAAYVKVANLFGVTLKERILIDGSYVSRPVQKPEERLVNQLIGFLPVFGVAYERSIAQAPRLEQVRAFLAQLTPPPFPGPRDASLAQQGRALFRQRCAGCHGDRDETGVYRYPNQRIALEEIGTDPTRARALPPPLVRQFNQTPVGQYMTLTETDAYAPPPLLGVWSTAPYLHNGSVPTLWQLLTPEARVPRFWLGGHRLDLKQVGVGDYPPGYVPWSEPMLYDTAQPGRSNRGHETQVKGLSEPDRWALIEYLKGL